MSLKGANIQRGKVGTNTIAGSTATSGLLVAGVEVPGKLEYGKTYTLFNLKDAEKKGITADYDAVNKVRLYRHIKEFYRRTGDGVKLFIMVAPQDISMTDLVNFEGDFAPKLIAKSKGEIHQLAIGINPATGYTPTMLDGMNSEVTAAIAKAQAFSDWCFSTHRPLNILLEGRDYGGDSSVLNLRDIPNVKAADVSVVIGQDYQYANTLDTLGQKFADVGAALGDVARKRVNECIAEVEDGNLTNAGLDAWLEAGLSSHQRIEDVESDLPTLDKKGFIFPVSYTGTPGYYWNDDHVCVEEVEDAEGNLNESSIAYGRTLKLASRLLRTALMPKIKSVQPVDPKTGKLPIGIIKYFEGLGDKALGQMSSELSGFKTIVDPDSNLLTGDKSLNISFTIIPYGKVGEINGTINLKRSL